MFRSLMAITTCHCVCSKRFFKTSNYKLSPISRRYKFTQYTRRPRTPPNFDRSPFSVSPGTMTTYGTIPTSSTGGTNVEYLTRAKERIKSGLGTRRPWKEMFNLGSIDFPHGLSDAFSRIKTNAGYFRMNYAIIVLSILFCSLLWHPISLIVFVVMMAAWLFLYFLRDEPLVVFHRTITDRTVLMVLSVSTIVLLLLTGATWNILSSILIGLAVVVVHAALRNTNDLSLDEDRFEVGG